MSSDDIFARRGERVTDPVDGTVVAFLKHDLTRKTVASRWDFAWIIAPHPESIGETPGFRVLPDGRPQVCIEGEWRPEPKEGGG